MTRDEWAAALRERFCAGTAEQRAKATSIALVNIDALAAFIAARATEGDDDDGLGGYLASEWLAAVGVTEHEPGEWVPLVGGEVLWARPTEGDDE